MVFSTETLAAGINMPARTTVISALSRRNDSGHVRLTHNQLLQMAGRAGRRGFDTAGALLVAAIYESCVLVCGLHRAGDHTHAYLSTCCGCACTGRHQGSPSAS